MPETNVRLVPESVARTVAINFSADPLYGANKGTNHYPYKSALHGNNSIKNFFVWKDSWGKPAVYVYNFAGGGFLLVSGDSALCPILAFVERGEFQKDSFPGGVDQWVKKTMSNIGLVRTGQYKPNTPASAWGAATRSAISGGNTKAPANKPGDPAVNYACTDVLSCSPQPPTGCVATAVAQIIGYWQPGNQYNYNYASMPPDYGNSEVKRLMRDVGLSENLNMKYHCASAGGSSAYASQVPETW